MFEKPCSNGLHFEIRTKCLKCDSGTRLFILQTEEVFCIFVSAGWNGCRENACSVCCGVFEMIMGFLSDGRDEYFNSS